MLLEYMAKLLLMGAGCVVTKTQMDPLLLFPVCFAGCQSSGRRMSWLKTVARRYDEI